jgi:cytochrome P450 PksS
MSQPLNRFDVWADSSRANPHPLYHQMRAEAPVYKAIGPQTGHTFYLLTRYADVVAVLKDHTRFANDFARALPPEELQTLGYEAGGSLGMLLQHLLNLDPPDHTRLRGLVHKAFTPRIIEGLNPLIQRKADELVAAIKAQPGQTVDLVEALAFPLPITVIAALLGVRADDRDRFRDWAQQILFNADLEVVQLAAFEMVAYFNDIIEQRRAAPQEDLISALVAAEEGGDTLSHQELISMIFLLLVAGYETTVNLIGTGTLNLLRHPAERQRLAADTSLIKTAVEEMLRCDGAAETTFTRLVTEDVEIGGVHIPRGQMVVPILLAANRDPLVFPDPDRFDITRNPNPHIALGMGIHYCLGAPLARAETAIAINTLLRELPRLELAVPEGELPWRTNVLLFHGLQALPVRF